MTTLADRAAAAAGRTGSPPQDEQDLRLPAEFVDEFPAPDPMAGYEPGDDDPEMVPVHIAWLRVRRDIRAISKREKYDAPGTKFNFRGVDTVVNCFGPVTLRHGVNVFPAQVQAQYRDTTTSKGNKMRECTVCVTWMIVGPAGDTFTAQSQGEALDSSDKGTAKAQSVALRVLLLNGGLTPTHDADPDTSHHERGEAPVRDAVSYRDEILKPETSRPRLAQINYEIKQNGMFSASITNEVGQPEQLGAFLYRIGNERIQGGEA